MLMLEAQLNKIRVNQIDLHYADIGKGAPAVFIHGGGVKDMNYMFQGAAAFNQDIGSWNTAKVTNMGSMFEDAAAFNQDIGSWDTSSVTHINNMFEDASAFDQAIGSWNVAAITDAADMFKGISLSTSNYDALLIGWNGQLQQNSVSFSTGGSTYCAGEAARASIVSSNSWSITDGEKASCSIWFLPMVVSSAG
jgi:surface protein